MKKRVVVVGKMNNDTWKYELKRGEKFLGAQVVAYERGGSVCFVFLQRRL